MRHVFRWASLVVIWSAVVAAPAIANSASYAFTMDLRYVNGSVNGVFHTLSGGYLRNSGYIWIYSKDGGASSDPNSVTIEVWDTDGIDNKVCSLTVKPYATVGLKKSYAKGCQSIDPDEYYIVAWKVEDDGNNIKDTGTLSTS
jgi:hypothetical protein